MNYALLDHLMGALLACRKDHPDLPGHLVNNEGQIAAHAGGELGAMLQIAFGAVAGVSPVQDEVGAYAEPPEYVHLATVDPETGNFRDGTCFYLRVRNPYNDAPEAVVEIPLGPGDGEVVALRGADPFRDDIHSMTLDASLMLRLGYALMRAAVFARARHAEAATRRLDLAATPARKA